MEEINNQSNFEQVKMQQNAEAFLNLATGIQGVPPLDEQADENIAPINETVQAQVNANLGLGPKYLDALKQISVLNDTRAFEVQLPISHQQVEITSMTGEEEQSLKSASITPEGFLRRLNEIIYNHLTYTNSGKPTFKDFLAELYPPDKSTLIWGLLVSSYAILPDIEKTCESCGENYLIQENPKAVVHPDTFKFTWDKPIPPSEYTETQKVFDGFITFEIGLPSEKDRIVLTSLINPNDLKENAKKSDTIYSFVDTLIFFTKSITITDNNTKTVLVDVAQDIYPFLKNLTPKILDTIRAEIDITIFDKYLPDFYIDAACTHCGHQEKINIDPELTFFRKTISV